MAFKSRVVEIQQERPRLNTLGCLLVMGTLLVITFMIYGYNRADATNAISITAKVGAPLPKQPALITSPQNDEHVASAKTVVEGTCQPKMYITILSNDLIQGGTICSEEGLFAANIDLGGGDNLLTVRTNDGIDQSGPTAEPVKVISEGTEGRLKISVDKAYQRIGLDDTLSWKVDLLGPASMHAVRIDWGDGSSDLLPTSEKTLVLSHKYTEAGARGVKISASDNLNNKAEINLVASVSSLATLNSQVVGKAGSYLSNAALYITVVLMAASFIVGNYYRGGKKYAWAQEERKETTEIAYEKNYYVANSSNPLN